MQRPAGRYHDLVLGSPKILLLALALTLSACGLRHKPVQALQVVRVGPESSQREGTMAAPLPLFLNQRVTVDFSADIDPLSVTSDTVRILRVGDGVTYKVKPARVRVGTRRITIEPVPPMAADYMDGSFQPGQLYRLEIAGFPLTNTVTSKSGQGLAGMVVHYFRAVSVAGSQSPFPSPLLPVGLGSEPFRLRSEALEMAAQTGRLQLHFSLPLLPPSVRPESFRVLHSAAGEAGEIPPRQLAVAGVRIRSMPPPVDPYPGCTVELTFQDPSQIHAGDHVFVNLQPEFMVQDYRGRGVTDMTQQGSQSMIVPVFPGLQLPRLQLPERGRDESERMWFAPVDAWHLGFEWYQDKIRPLTRQAGGDGRLGVFHPQTSLILRPGQSFIRQDGSQSQASNDMQFFAMVIPEGVTVTIQSAQPVSLRCCGQIRIHGELVLDTPREEPPSLGTPQSLADLQSQAGLSLLAAGGIWVKGRIRHQKGSLEGVSALTLISGAQLRLEGQVPLDTVVVTELAKVDRRRVVGQSLHHWTLPLERGLPAGVQHSAKAWTSWLALETDLPGPAIVQCSAQTPNMQVAVQMALPDPLDPSRPFQNSAGMPEPQPLPLRQALDLPENGFLRFQFQALVGDGTEASVEGLQVLRP